MTESSESEVSRIPVWGIPRVDPGYIYILEEQGRLKIGKTGDREKRLREARTWLPDAKLVGIKPFWLISQFEKDIHEGIAPWWYHKEWFEPGDDPYLEDFLFNFRAFSDEDARRDMNSVNFIYWMHDMMEFAAERASRKQSLRAFQRDISVAKKEV